MKGRLIWITGLSGAGKTSVAKQVFDKVKSAFLNTAMILGKFLTMI
jgi:adenylylsulfate kinase-like enzyme